MLNSRPALLVDVSTLQVADKYLQADLDRILEARVPELEAPSVDLDEDTLLAALFVTFEIPPPPPREHTKRRRGREEDESRTRKKEHREIEAVRRSSMLMRRRVRLGLESQIPGHLAPMMWRQREARLIVLLLMVHN